MIHFPRRFLRIFWRVAGAALLGAVCLLPGTVAAEAGGKKNFDIPAGSATASLKQFAQQSGVELLYSTEAIAGAKTRAVSGQMVPREALALMLSGSELTMAEGRTNGAIAVTRAPSPNAPRAAPVVPSDRPNPEAASGPVVRMQNYQVLGTRLRQVEAEAASPVMAYDRQAISATGAMNLSDFLNSLPQTYGGAAIGRNSAPSDLSMLGGARVEGQLPFGQVAGQGPALASNLPVQTGVSGVSLRNLGSGSTLVLVDGRRVAQSGVANRSSATGQGFVDLNAIPLGLIERVEIITDGASAIYGADAVAGVINIVLRKNWSGADLSGSLRLTEHGGATEWQTTLTSGFAVKKLRGTFAIDYYTREALTASMRSFSRRMNYTDVYLGVGQFGSAYGNDYRLQFGYAPSVQAVPFGSTFVNLPGIRVALAPEGATATPALSAFTSVTTNAPNQSSTLTTIIAQGQRQTNAAGYLHLVPKVERNGITGNFSYDWGNGAESYGTVSHTESRSYAQTLPAFIATPNNAVGTAYIVPAAYNPFGQDVAIGMVLAGFGAISQQTKTITDSITAGVRGKFGQTWRWDTGARWQRQDFRQTNRNFNDNAIAVNSILGSPDANARFNPFIADPQAAKLERLALYPTVDATSALRSIDGSVNGTLFEMWGGPSQMALGLSAEILNNDSTAVTFAPAANPVAVSRVLANDRKTNAGFGELSLPFFGKKNRAPLLQRLEFNVAGRYESFSDMNRSFVPKYGAVWSPAASLLLRVGRAEGYRAPSMTEDLIAVSSGTAVALDPARGNAVSIFTQITRPNADLKAETSKNDYYGLVFEPRFAKGLSLQVNYYQTVQKDAIQYLNAGTIVRNESLFPGLVTRGAPTAVDSARGQPGGITQVINQAFNFGRVKNASVDYVIDWRVPSERFGQWRISLNTARTLKATRELSPGVAPVDDAGDTYGGPKWNARGLLTWHRAAWTASAALNYLSGFNSDKAGLSTFTTASVPAMQKIDVRFGHEIQRALWRGRGKGLRLNFGVSNLRDKRPPFTNTIYGFNAGLHGQFVFGRAYEFSFELPLK